MNIFLYDDYKVFLRDYIKKENQKGRGFPSKISAALNLHASHVSAVINGDKDFTFEQFYSLAGFLKLDAHEADYFMVMAQYSRAGSHNYKQYLKKKLAASKQSGLRKQKIFDKTKELSSEEKSIFYSSWTYQAVQLYCSTSNGRTFEDIKNRFNLDKQLLNEVLEFLLNAGLCTQKENIYTTVNVKTVITSSSPLWSNNHRNWRLKSVQKSENVSPNEIMYTSTMTLSVNDFDYIRDEFLKLIKSLSKRIDESPSEELACLNVDWFMVK